jgi:hypothetical protein
MEILSLLVKVQKRKGIVSDCEFFLYYWTEQSHHDHATTEPPQALETEIPIACRQFSTSILV